MDETSCRSVQFVRVQNKMEFQNEQNFPLKNEVFMYIRSSYRSSVLSKVIELPKFQTWKIQLNPGIL